MVGGHDQPDGRPNSGPPEPGGIGWDRLALALDPGRWALARALGAAGDALADGCDSVIVAVAGRCLVAGPLTGLHDGGGDLVVVPRVHALPPPDGRAPTLADLIDAGRYCTSVLLARPGAAASLAAMQQLLCTETELTAGQVVEAAVEWLGGSPSDDPALGVGWWRPPQGPIALVDLEGFDPEQPWLLRPTEAPARVLFSDHPDLAAVVAEGVDQVLPPCELRLPGGIAVDATLRAIVADVVRAHRTTGVPLCPPPFARTPAFLRWASQPDEAHPTGLGPYWEEVRERRGDVRRAYPEVAVGRLAGFQQWADDRWHAEGESFLFRPPEVRRVYGARDEDRKPGGVNLIGYLDRASGLGEAARDLGTAFEAAGLEVSRVALGGTTSPLADQAPECSQALRYDTNVIVVTAEQFSRVRDQLGVDPYDGRRTIGYWFWELDTPSELARAAAPLVDEIWVASAFAEDTFADRLGRPVRRVPLPRPELVPSGKSRADLGLDEGRFTFLCSFDLLSDVVRKNPVGVVEAFTAAFAPDEGPILVIKSINGQRRWDDIERVRIAAGGRPDIRFWDENLDRGDQLALIRAADCLASLHRSEGLGMQLLEAMALDTVVLATGYSGPADFLDPAWSEVIPFTLAPIGRGSAAYPRDGRWAEPDLEAAAQAMARLAHDPAHVARLVARARVRVEELPGLTAVGLLARSALEHPGEPSS